MTSKRWGRSSIGAALLFAAAWCDGAGAQSPLTTRFLASTYLQSTDGCVYFDLAVATPLQITQFDCDLAQALGGNGSIDVYVRPDTWVGHTDAIGDWALAGSGPIVAAPIDQPSPCVLARPIALPPGHYGLALHHRGIAPAYSIHLAGLQTFTTAELSLTTGASTLMRFAGQLFTPRVWNGAVHYAPVAQAPALASAASFGAGCYAMASSFYELFGPGAADLDGRTLTLVPNRRGGYDAQCALGTASMLPTGINLGVQRGGGAAVALPFTFPFPGGATTAVTVDAAGQLVLADDLLALTYAPPSAAQLLNGLPRVCAAWTDLAPTGATNVWLQQDLAAQVVAFVWVDVPEYQALGTANTFAIRLHGDGRIELSWRSAQTVMAGRQMLVGFSPGARARDPGARDLSAAVPFVTGPDATGLVLAAVQRPVPGQTLELRSSGLPAAGFGALLLATDALPRPRDLDFLGAPGCAQHVRDVGAAVAFACQPSVTTTLRVPAGTALLGTRFVAQAIAAMPGANTLGAITSNGVRCAIGAY